MSISANLSPAEVDQQGKDEAIAGLINAALDALTGNTIGNLAKNVAGLVTLVDRFSTPEVQNLLEAVLNNTNAITETINTLGKLVENGSLSKITEILDFVRAILDSANGALVSSVAAKAVEMGSLLDQVAGSPVVQLVPGAIDAMESAYRQVSVNTDGVKLREILKLARDPQTLASVKFILLVLQGMEGTIRPQKS